MLELADAPRRRAARHRPLRAHRARRARPARPRRRRSRARTRATCSPSSTRRCSTGSASRSAGSPRTRCAQLARDAGPARWPTSARARTSASSPASAAARSFSATAARACARPGEIVDRQGRVLGRHEGHHNFTVGQRRGLGSRRREPLYVLEKDADDATASWSARRQALATTHGAPRGRHAFTAPPPRSSRSGCATTRSPIACRALERDGRRARARAGRAPPTPWRPGSSRA